MLIPAISRRAFLGAAAAFASASPTALLGRSQQAMAAGIKFSFGSNTHGEDVGRVEYGVQMAKECGLTAKNMFAPPPHDQKPIIRRGA